MKIISFYRNHNKLLTIPKLNSALSFEWDVIFILKQDPWIKKIMVLFIYSFFVVVVKETLFTQKEKFS